MKTLPLTLLAAALTASPLLAQTATTPATSPPSAAKEETVVLSPFEVSTSSDVGYIATNSLAGSRLNASLKDCQRSVKVYQGGRFKVYHL